MSRKEPKCNHVRRGIVTAGGAQSAHAAVSVCLRPECIADAIAWAEATTSLPARFVRDDERLAVSQPSFGDSWGY